MSLLFWFMSPSMIKQTVTVDFSLLGEYSPLNWDWKVWHKGRFHSGCATISGKNSHAKDWGNVQKHRLPNVPNFCFLIHFLYRYLRCSNLYPCSQMHTTKVKMSEYNFVSVCKSQYYSIATGSWPLGSKHYDFTGCIILNSWINSTYKYYFFPGFG